MAELEIIAPPKTITVTFSLEPAYSVMNSLLLLNATEQFSGLGEEIYRIAAALPPEQLHRNRLVLDALHVGERLAGDPWPSFPAWVDDLAARDPYALRDQRLEELYTKAGEKLGGEVPAPERLLADRAAYLALIERLHDGEDKEKGEEYAPALWEEAHVLLNDPPAMHDLTVTHLRAMWDEVMAPVWERNLPMLQESAAAFETLDFAGMSPAEVMRRVTGRDLPAEWEEELSDVEQIIFVPSPHLGPYVGLMCFDDGATAWILFGARVPEGVSASSPGLSRSELLMRLSALADETRLCILELLADEGELSAPEIMASLDLSQSAASRHLRQLAATGYLTVARREGAKFYRLNHDRVDDTFGALRKTLQ